MIATAAGALGIVPALTWVGDIGPRAVLIFHGGEDELVPIRSGEKLFGLAQDSKELWHEPSVRHNAFFRTLPLDYEQRIVAFLDRFLLGIEAARPERLNRNTANWKEVSRHEQLRAG